MKREIVIISELVILYSYLFLCVLCSSFRKNRVSLPREGFIIFNSPRQDSMVLLLQKSDLSPDFCQGDTGGQSASVREVSVV